MSACWAQTEDPSGCGAASPSQGRWDPDSLRPALSLGKSGPGNRGRSACGPTHVARPALQTGLPRSSAPEQSRVHVVW